MKGKASVHEGEPVCFFICSCRDHCLVTFLSGKLRWMEKPPRIYWKYTEKTDAFKIDENQNKQ